MLLQAILRIVAVKLAGKKIAEASNMNFLKRLKIQLNLNFLKCQLNGSYSLCKTGINDLPRGSCLKLLYIAYHCLA